MDRTCIHRGVGLGAVKNERSTADRGSVLPLVRLAWLGGWLWNDV
jgi:hypothetical protein